LNGSRPRDPHARPVQNDASAHKYESVIDARPAKKRPDPAFL